MNIVQILIKRKQLAERARDCFDDALIAWFCEQYEASLEYMEDCCKYDPRPEYKHLFALQKKAIETDQWEDYEIYEAASSKYFNQDEFGVWGLRYE